MIIYHFSGIQIQLIVNRLDDLCLIILIMNQSFSQEEKIALILDTYFYSWSISDIWIFVYFIPRCKLFLIELMTSLLIIIHRRGKIVFDIENTSLMKFYPAAS